MIKKFYIMPLIALSLIASSNASDGLGIALALDAPVTILKLKDEGYKNINRGFNANVFTYERTIVGTLKMGFGYQQDMIYSNVDSLSDITFRCISILQEYQSPLFYHVGFNYGIGWVKRDSEKATIYVGGILYTGLQAQWTDHITTKVSVYNTVLVDGSSKFWHQTFSTLITAIPSTLLDKIHTLGYEISSPPVIVLSYIGLMGYNGLLTYLHSKRYPWPFDDDVETKNFITPSLCIDYNF